MPQQVKWIAWQADDLSSIPESHIRKTDAVTRQEAETGHSSESWKAN